MRKSKIFSSLLVGGLWIGWLTACQFNGNVALTTPPAAVLATSLPESTAMPATLPAATPTVAPSTSLDIIIPGNTDGWLNTGIWLKVGDVVNLQASGTINIWPNCEETKAGAGFSDLDCQLVTAIGPTGTTAFEPAKTGYPYPGGAVAALVVRVGEAAPALTGEQNTFTVTVGGLLKFAINDIESLGDNRDQFVARVTVPYTLTPNSLNGTWAETQIELTAGETFTLTAAGQINMWPNCAETKVERGYPDFDCAQATVGPDGISVFPAEPDYPLPGANTMALIGRIGNGPVFRVGAGGVWTADASGPLLVTTNDTPYWKQDDQGVFVVTVTRGPAASMELKIR